MTTKIMQRLAGKVSVVIMVALLIAAVGTYGLTNSKHDSTARAAAAAVSPSPVETASAAPAKATVVNDVSVSVRATPSPSVTAPSASSPASAPTFTMAPPETAKAQTTPLANARATYAQLPLSFIPNQGQFEKGVEYEARGSGYITSLTADAAYIGLHRVTNGAKPAQQSLVRIGFQGANPMRFDPSEKQKSYANYFGGPASHWKEHVPNYGRVTAAEVYPGIDATFYGNRSSLQFDMVVKPGADPKAIRLKIEGGAMKLQDNGDIAVATELGTVYERKPVLYQEVNGGRQQVEGGYQIDGDTVTFAVGAYDPTRALVIDPVSNFSLVVDGVADTILNAVAEDAGAVYVAGTTTSNNLNLGAATSPLPGGGTRAASSQSDAIIVSFTRDGTAANWFNFIGGSSQDSGYGVAVDDPTTNGITAVGFPNAQFAIYLVGQTFSADFAQAATATNAYQGGGDGFVISFNGTGSLQNGPKYIGGPNGDAATSVAVRCKNSCATHAGQDDLFIGMYVGSSIAVPAALTLTGPGFGSGSQAGAIVELRASTLGTGGVHGDVFYISASQTVSVTGLALLPFPTLGGILQPTTQLAFVGNVSTPGGLTNMTNTVQGGHGGTDGNGYGGGASDGMWGVTNTSQSGTLTPLTVLSNLDYVGGAGDDNFKAVAALPDGKIVVVGDTNALPVTTTGSGGVLPTGAGSCGTGVPGGPATNCSFGSNGMAASGGTENVAAVVISASGIGATATATVGATAAGTATVGATATPTITYGTPATVANAAAGVNAQSTVAAGTLPTYTIANGTPFTLTLTNGVDVSMTPVFTGTVGPPLGFALTGITINNLGTNQGYWTAPTLTFTANGGANCSTGGHSLPAAHATIDGAGHVNGFGIDSAGNCAIGIGQSVTITAQSSGLQGVAVATAGTGYQGATTINLAGTSPVFAPAFVCTGGTVPSLAIKSNGLSSATNQGFPVGALTPETAGAPTAGQFNPGIGCSTQATTAGTNPNIPTNAATAPGIAAFTITNAGNGYQGGDTVGAVTFDGTCATFPTASTVVPNAGQSNQGVVATPPTNILTNSGFGCTTFPTAAATTFTPPGISADNVVVPGGTGYSTLDTPLVTFNGSCTRPPAATAVINNVSGNITSFTLTDSGFNCTTPVTTQTVDAGGVTNIQVLTGGSGYTTAPSVTVAPPTGPSGGGHCHTTATASATISGGAVTSIQVTNPGCGYVTGVNPAVTIGGPGVIINAGAAPGNGGTGYTQSAAPTVSLPVGFCSTGLNPLNVAPTFNASSVTISPVSGATGGVITSITPSNAASVSCSGATGTFPLTLTGHTPGLVSIQQSAAGNSYNVAPRLTFPNCSVGTPPMVTSTLAGAAPNGVNPTGYTISSYGADCTPSYTPPAAATSTTIHYTTPGLLSPATPPASTFTITNPGIGYSSAPTVSVSGCAVSPAVAATAVLAVPPGNPGTVASIALNSLTSGGDDCGDGGPVTVTLSCGQTPGFSALDYIGGAGGGALPVVPDQVSQLFQNTCASGCSYGNGVSTDANGFIYIAGQTSSPSFPVIVNPAWVGSTALKGNSDGFVARITETGGTIQGINGGGFSTYFGGSTGPSAAGGNDAFLAVTTDSLLNIFLAGQTWSSDFPITQGLNFSGNSAGTLTNLLFNNMVITGPSPATTPATSATFLTSFDSAPPTQTFAVNFANVIVPYSVAGGSVGGPPGSTIIYSANSGANQWLTITTAPGGFTLNVNPGTGSSGLAPDNYTASFTINAPNSDTPPVTFTVLLTVTANFQIFNCPSTGCVNATPSVTSFGFTYTKAEANAASVTPNQTMLIGLVGLPAGSTTPGSYPAPGTANVKANYVTNNAMIANGNNAIAATNGNFKWFSIGGADCSVVTGCTEPMGLPGVALSINPAVLDTLWESGAGITTMASGTITFSQTNPGGGGITPLTITITATVTPRLILTAADPAYPATLGFAFSCTTSGGVCTTINNSATTHVQLRGKDDVINIVSAGNNGKIAILTPDTTNFTASTDAPPGGSFSCFSANGVNGGTTLVPAGAYQAASSIDPTSNDLSLPVTITINNGAANCVQGVYHGLLAISGAAGNLGAGDSIQTNVAGITALGPNDSPAAIAPTLVPVTITLGNELQSSVTSFAFPNYVIDSQEGLPGTGCTSAPCTNGNAIPANITATASLTLPPANFNTSYAVTCSVNAIGGLYTPVTGSQTSSTAATCDWLTASISSSTLSGPGPTTCAATPSSCATLTVGVTSSGTNNVTVLPTNGGPGGNTYSGTITLTYESGTLAGSSLSYPVTITVIRQPLNWNVSAGGNAPTTNFTATIGGGVPAPMSCGALFSNENFIGAGTGEYVAFNPRGVGLNVAALANQTFGAINPATGGSGASVTAGWLTVTQSGGAGAAVGSSDGLTCSLNLTNLAPGLYTACVDAVDLGPGGSASGPTPHFNSGATDCTAAATGAFPGVGRKVATVTLNLQSAPQLTASPSGFTWTFQQGTGGNSGFQTGPGLSANPATLTLTDSSSTANIQNVFATTSLPWLALTGPATAAGGVTVAASGNTAVTLTVTPPACAQATCTFSGVISLACSNCTLLPSTIPVTLTVNGQPTITTVPGTLTNFTFQQGGPTPANENLVVNLTSGTGNVTLTPASCGTPGATCSGATWLQVCAGAGCTPTASATAAQPISTTGLPFTVAVDPAQLNAMAASNTPYNGSVTISVPGSSNNCPGAACGTVTLNVSVTVIAQPTLVTSPSSGAFGYTVGNTPANVTTPASSTLMVSATTATGQSANAGFTLTSSSNTSVAGGSNWLLINGVSTAISNTATINPLSYTISVSPTALAALAASIPSGSSQSFTGTVSIVTTTPPASNDTAATVIATYTLTVANIPVITVSCPSTSFAYTLTKPATVPPSIVCTVSDSSTSVGINNLVVSGCPGSWLTCTPGATNLAAGGSTTLTLTPTNLANQNPGTFGGSDQITVSGTIAPTATTPGGGAATPGSVSAVTITNTPLTTVSPTSLTFGGASGYTQGNLATPGNQAVTGSLAEGTGGTPAGPGSPGTGTLTAVVANSSFAPGSCTGGVTQGPINWLAVTQSSTGSGSAAVYTFTVAVNTGVFPVLTASATCTGAITVNSTGVTPAAATVSIPVSFIINPQSGFTVTGPQGVIPTGGTLTPGLLAVNGYPVSGITTAGPVPFTVSSNPTPGQQYTVTIQPVTGQISGQPYWLQASGCTAALPCTANTGSGFTLSANASASLEQSGNYFATVSVASAGSTSSPSNTVTFTVGLTVDATTVLSTTGSPALTGNPPSFNLGTHFPFFTSPSTQTLLVSTMSPTAGAPPTPATFTVTQGSLSGSTPNNLLVINGTQPFSTTGTATTTPVTITYNAAVANTLGTTAPGTYGGTVVVTVLGTGGVTTVPQTITIPWSITIDAEAAIQTGPSAAQGVIISCVINTVCTGTAAPFTVAVGASSTGQNVNIPVSAQPTSLPIPWLSITSAPTTANSTSIVLSANTAGLQANTSYAGQIVVTSADASNSPYTVPVTLNVLPPPSCTFGNPIPPISLPATGTSTGGVLPETPMSVALNASALCTGSFTVTSDSPWLSATGGSTVALTAFSNPHSTSRTGTLTITYPGLTSQTVAVTEGASSLPSYPNRQVTALYETVLGRDPDQGGYNYWITSGLPLGTMADDFFTSPEVYNSDFAVLAAYQAATGAPPSYAQFLTAIAQIRANTQTIPGLFSQLIASNSSYSAATLYQNLLNRATTSGDSACVASGVVSCFQTLIAFPSSVTPVGAANNEFQSTGTFAHGADHTNGLYITMLYFTILNRDPDQGGYNFWLGVANAGGPGIMFQGPASYATRIQILGPGTQGQGFIGSQEFVNDYI